MSQQLLILVLLLIESIFTGGASLNSVSCLAFRFAAINRGLTRSVPLLLLTCCSLLIHTSVRNCFIMFI